MDLLKSIEMLGVKPNNIYFLGKIYSSSNEVITKIIASEYNYQETSEPYHIGSFSECFKFDIKKLWQMVINDLSHKNIDGLIILDDGGCCISSVPTFIVEKYKVCGIEQTSSGLHRIKRNNQNVPVVAVASSAAKQLIESNMIAEATVHKISSLFALYSNKLSCAVVGLGVIGIAVARKLMSMGHKVIVYDIDQKKIKHTDDFEYATDINSVFTTADYIFGCSGDDITKNLDVSNLTTNKFCISCSSHDKEFLTLIKKIHKEFHYLEESNGIRCTLNNGSVIEILKKGYPINFDQTGESVIARDIQLTRGLLLGGIIQAVMSLDTYPKQYEQYMLSPTIQKFVIQHWLPYGSSQFTERINLAEFLDVEWINSKSGGIDCKQKAIMDLFNN